MLTTIEKTLCWRDEFVCGIDSIDREHKRLVEMVGEYRKAIEGGRGSQQVDRLLFDLIRYTDEHFRNEERVWREHNVSSQKEHALLHENLRRQVVEMREKARSGRLKSEMLVYQFLVHWLLFHIQEHDKRAAREALAKKTR